MRPCFKGHESLAVLSPQLQQTKVELRASLPKTSPGPESSPFQVSGLFGSSPQVMVWHTNSNGPAAEKLRAPLFALLRRVRASVSLRATGNTSSQGRSTHSEPAYHVASLHCLLQPCCMSLEPPPPFRLPATPSHNQQHRLCRFVNPCNTACYLYCFFASSFMQASLQ